MYKYGMTQWVAGGEDIGRSFERLARLGYDSIEYASDPAGLDRARCRALMEKHQMACLSLCGLFDDSRDLTLCPDEAASARKYLKDSVDLALEMGAKVLIVVPSPVGRTLPPKGAAYAKMWDNAVANLKMFAPYACDKGVSLAIEPINRYETYLVNTVAQACQMADQIASPAVGVMADAFHMSIEEANIASAVRAAGAHIRHVHIADSTRGPAGAGSTNFSDMLNALLDIGYAGTLTMEFMCRTANPYAARDMGTLSDMMDRYAQISIDYMRALECAVRAVREGEWQGRER